MLRPDRATVAYRRLCVTLLSVYWGINRLIPWQVLRYALTGHVRPPSGFGPGPLSILCPLSPATYTHTHTHTHTQTASHWQPHQSGNTKCYSCLLKSRMSFPPGIKSQSKNGASERGGGEEERTAQTEPHLAASCSALCQIETEASCTLCRHTHVHTHTYTHTHTQIWSVL